MALPVPSCSTILVKRLGEAFYNELRPILAQIDALERKYGIKGDGEKLKPVSLGGSYGPATLVLPSLIAAFAEAHPSIEIDFTVRSSPNMQNLVANSRLDLAVITNPTPLASLTMEPFKPFQLCFFVSAHHPLADERKVTLETLAQYQLISGRERDGRSRTDELLNSMRARGVKPKGILRCEWPDAVRALVRQSEAIGLLYRDLVEQGIKEGLFRMLDLAGVNLSVISYILYSAEKPLSQNAKEFLGFLRAARGESSLDNTQLRASSIGRGKKAAAIST